MSQAPVYGAIEYEVRPGHIHQLIIDAGELLTGDVIEELAGELAEAVQRCNEERHDGHGRQHTGDDVRKAYSAAVQQLLTADFRSEQLELDRKIRVFKKWGGQVPAAALMFDPDDRKQLNLLTTDQEGNPSIRKVTDKSLIDMIPYPDEKNAVRDREGVSWQRKRKLKAETKLRRLRDA